MKKLLIFLLLGIVGVFGSCSVIAQKDSLSTSKDTILVGLWDLGKNHQTWNMPDSWSEGTHYLKEKDRTLDSLEGERASAYAKVAEETYNISKLGDYWAKLVYLRLAEVDSPSVYCEHCDLTEGWLHDRLDAAIKRIALANDHMVELSFLIANRRKKLLKESL